MLLLERLHFVRCRICCWVIVLSLAMPRLYDEGFCFAGCCMLKDSSSRVECLRIPSGWESESAVVLAMRANRSVLGGLDARPPKVPVSHVWAYRDVPDDALAVLLFVRHARRLWTLLNKAVPNCLDGVFNYPLYLRKLGFVLCLLDLLETPRLWIVEAALDCPGACCGGGLVLTQMTRSVPTSLDRVTHYGDLGVNFNQGGPSVRRLPRLCWCELQPRMPQCTSLGNAYRGWMMSEVVSVRALNANAPVFIVDVIHGGRFVQPSPLTVSCRQCQLKWLR
ncbi:hypothetical protein CRG98_013292 [Punica granatum]|uniref:Secreted protein n=1 Tax=Punica granatum TaxID=22663 RepID=A0A2I0KDK3_PUNGR|nr:hypothetical protein CRG98_013292 [Punica granatum]